MCQQVLDRAERALENRKRKAMTSEREAEFEEIPASTGFKSAVWEHFGFAVEYNDAGERTVDKTNTVCKLCMQRVSYRDWCTGNLSGHLHRHHNMSISPVKPREQVSPSGKKTCFHSEKHSKITYITFPLKWKAW